MKNCSYRRRREQKVAQALIAFGLVMLLFVGCGDSGKIEGTVMLNCGVAKPIANVTVELTTGMFATPALEKVATTVTDSQGEYSFEDVEPGSYVVTAYVQDEWSMMDLDITVDAGGVVRTDFSRPCTP